MKQRTLMVLAALMLSAAVPALAQQTNEEKVICELASKNCLSQSAAIQKRIKKLETDIKKGKTYPAEDVKKLEQKLKEAQEILDKLEGKTK